MGTRCYVGIEGQNDDVNYAYVHYDGYPDGVGKLIVKMDRDEVLRKVVSKGDCRCLSLVGGEAEQLHSGQKCPHYAQSRESFADKSGNVSYAYLLTKDDEWLVLGVDDSGWSPLRDVLSLPPQVVGFRDPCQVPGCHGGDGIHIDECPAAVKTNAETS